MAVNNKDAYGFDVLEYVEHVPGGSIAMTTADKLLHWGAANSLWMFAMGTSCCALELMATFAGRLDLDRFGSIIRGTPRQCDVMLVAGTITVKMAPRVKKLWDQMPEPRWAMAMGSCAISGDFYRDIYSVVPGVDTILPVDVYIPGCPPNPEGLVDGLRRLQEKIRKQRNGEWAPAETRPETEKMINPEVKRFTDKERDHGLDAQQLKDVLEMDKGCAVHGKLPILGQAVPRKSLPEEQK